MFRRAPELRAETVLVAGGVYGNPHALAALEERADRERSRATIVLNGDFNWFDAEPRAFAALNARALRHAATRGNVETEIASDDDAGCGCGYPEWVGDAEVARSNRIMSMLRTASADTPDLRAALGALPMHLLAGVGDARIAIVHGDAWSLAGWDFAQERLDAESSRLDEAWREADVDAFASSHTCLPVAISGFVDGRPRALVNNGAAGMPNFAGTTFGIATRIATEPSTDALYRFAIAGVWIEAVPIRYDAAAWLRDFDRLWPAGSPAALSYRQRLVAGPSFRLGQAVRGGFELAADGGGLA